MTEVDRVRLESDVHPVQGDILALQEIARARRLRSDEEARDPRLLGFALRRSTRQVDALEPTAEFDDKLLPKKPAYTLNTWKSHRRSGPINRLFDVVDETLYSAEFQARELGARAVALAKPFTRR